MLEDYARIEKSTLKKIGDSIRRKKGTNILYNPLDMPEQIDSIQTGDIQIEEYNGNYEVIPRVEKTQILETQNKYMKNDVSVKPIPYFETSNISEGKTAIIGEGDISQNGSISLQQKTIIPNNYQQIVIPDEGYNALSKVTVEKIPNDYIIPTGTLDIKNNGEYIISNYEKVNVNVENNNESEIPYDYKRVDFIEFTGEQFVDTNIIGNQDIEINICFTRGETSQKYLFGCASPDNLSSITAYVQGVWRFGNKYAAKSLDTINNKISYGALVNKNTISVTGNVTSISDTYDFETIGTLLLGGCRNSDGSLPKTFFVGRVFYFIINNLEGNILRFIPVLDEFGTYGFFDVVSKKFFGSLTNTPLKGGNL